VPERTTASGEGEFDGSSRHTRRANSAMHWLGDARGERAPSSDRSCDESARAEWVEPQLLAQETPNLTRMR
jgi:hypothetical protein